MDAAKTVSATFDQAGNGGGGGGPRYTLTVSTSGAGGGTVTSSPASLACPPTCSADYESGTIVTLTATPDATSSFAGWSDPCGTGASCVITLDAPRTVTASFDVLGGGGGGGTFVGPVIKVSVKETGIYSLTAQDLKAAGWDTTGVDPRTITMIYRGAEMPIEVLSKADGSLDTVVFYGTGIGRNSPQYDVTDTNVYWIGAGTAFGRRMTSKDGAPGASQPLAVFTNRLHVEQDAFYTFGKGFQNGASVDHWFWEGPIAAGQTRSYPFTVSNVSTTATGCTVRYYLQGKTDASQNPDHHTRILLNGRQVDDQSWNGFAQLIREVSLPDCGLVEGANTLTLESVGGTGASVDTVLFNWFEVDYGDTFVAETDTLAFNAVATGEVDFGIAGFSGSAVTVYDVTDPLDPAPITNTQVEPGGTTFRLKFRDALQGRRDYVALTPAQRKKPAGLTPDAPSSLKTAGNGADYLLIAHASLLNSVKPLADHRAAALTVRTVDVTDVYDEFSHGLFDPQAIKDFLAHAYANWQPWPTYVLLVGDANLDYKDNFKTGKKNLVPSHLIETAALGQTSSDIWFASVTGADPIPDLFIGRLPVKTPAEADAVISKIIAYETPMPTGWTSNVQFVADNAESGDASFASLLDQLIADYLPSTYTPRRVYLGVNYSTGSSARTAITNNLNIGALLTVYTGHGNVDFWAAEGMFTSSAVSSLSNPGRPSVVVTLNCLNGFFNDPFEGGFDQFGNLHGIPLAEAFLNAANKGAVAVWSPTGLGYTFEHDHLVRGLFDAVFRQHDTVLGSAIWRAQFSAFANFGVSEDTLQTFVLFGDPATRLAIP
jgi:hypothetical protein